MPAATTERTRWTPIGGRRSHRRVPELKSLPDRLDWSPEHPAGESMAYFQLKHWRMSATVWWPHIPSPLRRRLVLPKRPAFELASSTRWDVAAWTPILRLPPV